MAEKKKQGYIETSKAEPLSVKDKSLSIPAQAMKDDKCGSCNTSIVNDIGAVKFPCPNCGKYTVIRCLKCRKTVAKYKCPLCSFEGPN